MKKGTRSKHVEENLKKNFPHKHLILVLNKCDLIPTWLTVNLIYYVEIYSLNG